MIPRTELVESYLKGYTYTVFDVVPPALWMPEIGLAGQHIDIDRHGRRRSVYVGETGIEIVSTVPWFRICILYADPEFQDKLHQAICRQS